METMARFPDNYFDIAIVDPPYGILNKTKRGGDYKFNMAEYSQWDVKPGPEYFKELKRVSKHQIVWGGNYFGQIWAESEYNKCFLIWDKNQPETLNNFSMAEMAWTSLDKPSKIFHYSVRKNRGKIHPTQKPVKLLERLIKIFTDEGDVVIDPVAGSGSTLIAAENLNRKAHGFEIKKDFHAAATKWIEQNKLIRQEVKELGYAKTEISKTNPILF
jgi:site-specific DNA-methyltransferase (adenine-specific)